MNFQVVIAQCPRMFCVLIIALSQFMSGNRSAETHDIALGFAGTGGQMAYGQLESETRGQLLEKSRKDFSSLVTLAVIVFSMLRITSGLTIILRNRSMVYRQAFSYHASLCYPVHRIQCRNEFKPLARISFRRYPKQAGATTACLLIGRRFHTEQCDWFRGQNVATRSLAHE